MTTAKEFYILAATIGLVQGGVQAISRSFFSNLIPVEKASEFLGDFAKLIRLNLEYCTKPKISLEEEILYLKSYIKVENTRFNDSVKVNFHVDPDIDTYEVEVPSMLIQTFIENVFVHAFPPKIKNPTLNVSFNELDSGSIECRIEDNGVGFANASDNSS